MTNRQLPMFSTRVLVFFFLLLAIAAVSCGGDDSIVSDGQDADSDFPKVIRMAESTIIFTEDDLKSIGWKAQKDFLLDYPGTTTAKWGFLNQAEVGVLIYSNADDAKTLGIEAAEAQTFHNELGEAPGDGTMDRTSCQSAGWQSAVMEIGAGSIKVSASYLDPQDDSPTPPRQALPCPVRMPTYNDYTVIGNVVMLCEGDGSKPLETSTNCRELEKWLTE